MNNKIIARIQFKDVILERWDNLATVDGKKEYIPCLRIYRTYSGNQKAFHFRERDIEKVEEVIKKYKNNDYNPMN